MIPETYLILFNTCLSLVLSVSNFMFLFASRRTQITKDLLDSLTKQNEAKDEIIATQNKKIKKLEKIEAQFDNVERKLHEAESRLMQVNGEDYRAINQSLITAS